MGRFLPPGVLVLLTACGPSLDGDTASSEALTAVADATGIHRLEWRGVDLFEGVGGYYVIGTCTGADDAAHNVISKGSDGRTLASPGACPGAPFSISVRGDNPRRVSVRIGPLPVDYRGLSVPFDPAQRHFDRFRFSGDQHQVGCGASWSRRRGSGGPYTDIPQPCHIPGHGAVGVARVPGVGPGTWAEMSGPVARVRRRIIDTNARELWFIRHPYTHNMEISFNPEPISQHILPAGSTYYLEEEIWVEDPSAPTPAPPPPPPPVATAGGEPVDWLYRAVLGRDADPSGRATYGARAASSISEMKAVARALLASGEFATNVAPRGADAILDQLYRGLLGRSVDPSGRATFGPVAARGDYARIVDSLLDSAEFRARRPGPASGSGPSMPPPVTGGPDLLAPLYLALFDRAVDPSGRATFGPQLSTGDFEAMKSVGRQLMASPEFEAARAAHGPEGMLARMYRGLFGRALDPSGRGTFLPEMQAGRHIGVLEALVDSPEHRARY